LTGHGQNARFYGFENLARFAARFRYYKLSSEFSIATEPHVHAEEVVFQGVSPRPARLIALGPSRFCGSWSPWVGPAIRAVFQFRADRRGRRRRRRAAGGWFGGDLFAPFQQQPASSRGEILQDFSKAPPPEKPITLACRSEVSVGEGNVGARRRQWRNWLAYGLEGRLCRNRPDNGRGSEKGQEN